MYDLSWSIGTWYFLHKIFWNIIAWRIPNISASASGSWATPTTTVSSLFLKPTCTGSIFDFCSMAISMLQYQSACPHGGCLSLWERNPTLPKSTTDSQSNPNKNLSWSLECYSCAPAWQPHPLSWKFIGKGVGDAAFLKAWAVTWTLFFSCTNNIWKKGREIYDCTSLYNQII